MAFADLRECGREEFARPSSIIRDWRKVRWAAVSWMVGLVRNEVMKVTASSYVDSSPTVEATSDTSSTIGRSPRPVVRGRALRFLCRALLPALPDFLPLTKVAAESGREGGARESLKELGLLRERLDRFETRSDTGVWVRRT